MTIEKLIFHEKNTKNYPTSILKIYLYKIDFFLLKLLRNYRFYFYLHQKKCQTKHKNITQNTSNTKTRTRKNVARYRNNELIIFVEPKKICGTVCYLVMRDICQQKGVQGYTGVGRERLSAVTTEVYRNKFACIREIAVEFGSLGMAPFSVLSFYSLANLQA